MQDNGDGTYDILVDKFGGEGAGQFRTDSPQHIGSPPYTATNLASACCC